jgi:hypothetical protein
MPVQEQLQKKDLDILTEIHRRSIEISVEVAEQNSEMLNSLSNIKDSNGHLDTKIDKLVKLSEDIDRTLFRLGVVMATGVIGIVVQIIQAIKGNK